MEPLRERLPRRGAEGSSDTTRDMPSLKPHTQS